MHRSHHYIASLFLTAALAAPVPQEAGIQVCVYDRNHKDYHNWDDNENPPGATTSQKTTAPLTNIPSRRRRSSRNAGPGAMLIPTIATIATIATTTATRTRTVALPPLFSHSEPR